MMKSFEQWVTDMAPKAAESVEDSTEELVEVECCGCGSWGVPNYDVEYDEDEEIILSGEYWCGGSPRCCP